MTVGEAAVLVTAGIGAGLCGSIAGLASLISYPTLLALGLAPVTANVTNTVALVCSSAGSTLGSGPELRGQGALVRRLAVVSAAGGAIGGGLLLLTPAESFERIVPILIAGASVAIMLRRRLVATETSTEQRNQSTTARESGPTRASLFAVAAIGVYGGYFGAGAGVMLLALLLHTTGERLPTANAIKNAVLGCANGVAAVAFAVLGDVRWSIVAPLGVGLLIGGRCGPIVVRRAPTAPLRIIIATAGLGLAVKLAVDAYG